MRKLEVNYDVIDKAYEVQGKHKVRRWFRVNKLYDVVGAIAPATHLAMALSGAEPPEEALVRSMISIATNFGLWATLDKILESVRTKMTNITPSQKAWIELFILTEALRQTMNIDTTVEDLMNCEVYHKKYKLAMDGKPGIIRERFFNMPIKDPNGKEDTTSVKEEHVLGSKKYVLSLDKPVEQRQYKLAYNM